MAQALFDFRCFVKLFRQDESGASASKTPDEVKKESERKASEAAEAELEEKKVCVRLYLRRSVKLIRIQAKEEAATAAKAAIQKAIQEGRPIDLDSTNVVSIFCLLDSTVPVPPILSVDGLHL